MSENKTSNPKPVGFKVEGSEFKGSRAANTTEVKNLQEWIQQWNPQPATLIPTSSVRPGLLKLNAALFNRYVNYMLAAAKNILII